MISRDIQEAAGSHQLCAGQPAGCETTVLAARLMFSYPESEGFLLVDATNAFNSLNHHAVGLG